MGVIGLETYAQSREDVCRKVNIAEMAAEYRKLHPNMVGKPVIVMETYNCLRFWKTELEKIHGGHWINGGQWIEYKKMMEDFLSAFEKIGVQVVFFFSGIALNKKREKWMADYLGVAQKFQKTFQQIGSLQPLDPEFNMAPPALSTVILLALKYIFNASVYRNVAGRSVSTVASFADKNQCMAILAQDSDYIILPTVPYLSMQHLDLKNMCTIQYCRETMCRELDLKVWMLPLFACMVGKDMASREKLDDFHNNFRDVRYKRGFQRIYLTIRNIARCIASYGITTPEDLTSLIPKIHATCGIKFAMSLDELQEGIDCYSMTNTEYNKYTLPGKEENLQSDDIFEVILRKVKNCELAQIIPNVLFEGREMQYPCLENSKSFEAFPPCALVYRPLRQRMYGLIFELKDNFCDKNMVVPYLGTVLPTKNIVEEWWIDPLVNAGNIDNSFVTPLPVNLPDGISNATVLHDIIMEKDEHLLDKKWAVLLACLELTMSSATFQDIPHQYKSLAATLNYLIQHQDVKIKMWEFEVFLIQAVHPQFMDTEWQKDLQAQLERYNIRAVHLVTLFLKGSEAFLTLLHFAENPMEVEYGMPWNFFSAKLFHYIYTCTFGSADTKLSGNNLEMFQRLKGAILEGIDIETCFTE